MFNAWRSTAGFGDVREKGTKGVTPQALALRLEELERRELLDAALHHAFGTAPILEPGDQQITTAMVYTPHTGYGWQQGTVQTYTSHAVTSSGKYAVDLPAGNYQVTVTLGDSDERRNSVRVFLENSLAGTVSTTAGQVRTLTQSVTVADGQLNLALLGATTSGVIGKASVRRLDITPLSTTAQVVNTPTTFAFDPATTTIESGQPRVSEANAYDPEKGYGWTSGIYTATSTGVASPVGAFAANLPNGTYQVALKVGDLSSRPLMAVYLENSLVKVVTSNSSSDFTQTVSVTDGQLNLKLMDRGGSALGGVIRQMTISPVSVKPTPLSAKFASPGTVNEGDKATVSFSGVKGGSGGYAYSYDFNNDGTFEVTGSASASATVPSTYLDDGAGIRTVRGRVTDGAGAIKDYLASISVANVAPTASLSGSSSGQAGTAFSFTGSATDPSKADTNAGFSYGWDFGDGTTATGASTSHAYTSAGTYTVTLTATDKDGGKATRSTAVTVTAPISPLSATFAGPGTVNEGGTATVSFSGVKGGSGGYAYSYDFNNDGTFEVTGSGSGSATVPSAYLDDGAGTRTVRGRVTDSSGAIKDFTAGVVVSNVAPTVSLTSVVSGFSGTTSGHAGTVFSFTGSATDPSKADTQAGFSYSWDFGDDTIGTGASVSHAYTTAGTYTVSLTATDKDGGKATRSTAVTVTAPSSPLSATFAGPATVNEGGTATVSFSGVKGGSGGYAYSYDFNNDGTFEVTGSGSGSATVPSAYLDDGAGTRTVRGRVTDSSGAIKDFTAGVVVSNVAPTVSLTSVVSGFSGTTSGHAGTAFSFTGSATDPSKADTQAGFSYSWDFGDDSIGTGATVTHTYTSAGTYTVTLTVTDKDGGHGISTGTVTVTSPTASPLAATFGAASAVTEGTTATALFSTVQGGTGGYKYSYDFNNDGTFEVTGSASAQATVPASYLDDGPATRTVHGRVSDSSGAFQDYTAEIFVGNVTPTASVSAPATGSTGASLNFGGAATDPSGADAAAGFTYRWDFGDGSTGTGKAASHAYTAAGIYTVRLSVVDKDGGEGIATSTVTIGQPAPAGEFILVGQEKIPNFGANPTIVSARSGAWSDPNTWLAGRVPAAGDVVSIDTNDVVTYDMVSDAVIDTVVVQAGGHLVYRTDISTRLTVKNVLVLEQGELQIGTQANPVAASVKAEMIFANVAIDTTRDPSRAGNGLIGLGKVTMHGSVKSDTFVRLATEPKAGDTTLSLSQPASGWRVGDRVLLPGTHQWRVASGAAYPQEWELGTLSAVSADGRVLTLSLPLRFDHPGARDADGTLRFLPQVGNLTRNVVVRSQSATGTRGRVMFANRADVDVRYTQFSGLGRTTTAAIDDTTYDSTGAVTHVGTNQQGRYPVYFNHLYGPVGGQANGYQYTFVGNAVFCPVMSHTFKWGVALNDSHYGLIQDNILYNWAGSGLVTESGNESYNVIAHNFVVAGGGIGTRANGGNEGVAFWFRGPNNYVRDNSAANYFGNQLESAYGYKYYQVYLGNLRLPSFPGADTTIANQITIKNGNAMPLLEFARNEVYGMENGLSLWWIGAQDVQPLDVAPTVIKDFRDWHTSLYAFYGYPMNNVTFDGMVVRGDVSVLSNPNEFPYGLYFGDYMTSNLTVTNVDIQGQRIGVYAPYFAPGLTQIKNSYLRNAYNIAVRTPGSPGSAPNGFGIPGKKLVISDVKFDAVPGYATNNISTGYTTWYGSSNLTALDQILVYNYNRVAGDNFQVYYAEQAAGFIVPQSTSTLVGSPEAGLTNQQNWDKYRIAIAGAVAPADATSRDGIIGLVKRT